jgi:hypothetical protein
VVRELARLGTEGTRTRYEDVAVGVMRVRPLGSTRRIARLGRRRVRLLVRRISVRCVRRVRACRRGLILASSRRAELIKCGVLMDATNVSSVRTLQR